MLARLTSRYAVLIIGAWILVAELFSWREIKNGKQLGALVGLTPTPYDSGKSEREQGISKAGNKHVRALIVELAWMWLRWQPKSALSAWYERRFGAGNKRARKVGIVALARKLLIALWRYLEHGELPPGAEEANIYRGARAGYFVSDHKGDWQDVYTRQLEAGQHPPTLHAAE